MRYGEKDMETERQFGDWRIKDSFVMALVDLKIISHEMYYTEYLYKW